MSRLQLALNVANLDAAVEFYTKLFRTGPAKHEPGYANFTVAEPALKLILIEGHGVPGSINHLGIEVDSVDVVAGEVARLAAEGLATAVEEQVACGYALQDKVWVDAPDGGPWEIYTVLGPSDVAGAGCTPNSCTDLAACGPR
jgi:catechol 2,3-dioxygenase-like lactoylglutathione lyase family enzyme